MSGRLNSWLKSFFTLNKSEQRGIFILIFLIVLVGIINLLLPYFLSSNSDVDFHKHQNEINEFLYKQQVISDSVENRKLQKLEFDNPKSSSKLTPINFNPNKLSEEDWGKMGFSDRQIKNIKNYEAKGGKFRKKEDLKKMYSISEADYETIEPFIIIPQTNKNNKKSNSNYIFTNYQTTEINSADSISLVNSLGFSPKIASRTIGYRNLLGGFFKIEQLKDVYGLTDDFYNRVEQYIIIDTSLLVKIDINNIEFKALLKHPYFNYDLTIKLFNAKNKIGSFDNVDQIKHIDGITDSTYNKVSYYLYIRPELK